MKQYQKEIIAAYKSSVNDYASGEIVWCFSKYFEVDTTNECVIEYHQLLGVFKGVVIGSDELFCYVGLQHLQTLGLPNNCNIFPMLRSNVFALNTDRETMIRKGIPLMTQDRFFHGNQINKFFNQTMHSKERLHFMKSFNCWVWAAPMSISGTAGTSIVKVDNWWTALDNNELQRITGYFDKLENNNTLLTTINY